FAKYRFSPKISLSGRVWGSDVFTALSDEPDFEAGVANFPASGSVKAIPLPVDQLKLYETGRPFNIGSATFIPDAIDPDSRRESRFLAASTAFEHQLSPTGSYRVAYQLVDSARSFQDGPGGVGGFEPAFSNDSQFNGRIDLVQARTDHYIGSASLVTVGYEYEGETFANLQLETDPAAQSDRKSTRLNSSHVKISYAVFCLK